MTGGVPHKRGKIVLSVLHSGASEPSGSGEELGRFPSRSRMAKGEGGIRGERSISGPYRPIFHGPDELFSPPIEILKNIPAPNESNFKLLTNARTEQICLSQAHPFHEVDKDAHFAQWEQPGLFTEELRPVFRSVRL